MTALSPALSLFKSLPFRLLFATTALTAMVAAGPSDAFAIDAKATPTGESVVVGSVSFARPVAGRLDVNQSSSRAVIEWDSFDIGKNATAEFRQPGASSLTVNRVVRPGTDPTQILGTLKANGKLAVLDRNGVLFGKNSTVDVGSLLASTGDIDDDSIVNGDTEFTITGIGPGAIETHGKITVADAGLAAFVAPKFRNSGVITAKLGRVDIGSTNSVATVDLYGDDLIQLWAGSVGVLENTGEIRAEKGTIALSTNGLGDLIDSMINLDGIVNASSVTRDGGKIIIKAGGKVLDVKSSARVTADSSLKKGGMIEILPGSNPNVINGRMTANGKTSGGTFRVLHGGDLIIGEKAKIQVNASQGTGGTVDLGRVGEDCCIDEGMTAIHGLVETNGRGGGGFIRIQSNSNSNDQGLSIGTKARINANSEKGRGGDIYLTTLSGAPTVVAGQITSSGATGGGAITIDNGGFRAPFLIGRTARLLSEARNSGIGGDIALISGISEPGLDFMGEISGQVITRGKAGGGDIRVVNEPGTNFLPTSLLESRATGSGRGGDIDISTRSGISEGLISHAGRIISEGSAGGGNISFEADEVDLSENSSLISGSSRGAGGNIGISGGHDVRSRGLISSTGRTEGGTINLGADVAIVYSTSRIKSNGIGPDGKGGSVFVGGDAAGVAGDINADGKAGGGLISLFGFGGAGTGADSVLSAKATARGTGGRILIDSGMTDTLGGTLDVTGKDGGGEIEVLFDEDLLIKNTSRFLAASVRSGKGGNIEIIGFPVLYQGGVMDVSGIDGGGNILIEASGNSSLSVEDGLFMADAKQMGNGGTIVVNGGAAFSFSGDVYARGGKTYGNGGSFIANSLDDMNIDNALFHLDARGNGGGGFARFSSEVGAVCFSGDIFARGGKKSGDGGMVTFTNPNVIDPEATVDVTAQNGNDGTFNH